MTSAEYVPPVWAILAPVAADELRRLAIDARDAELADAGGSWPPTWSLVPGSGHYSMLIEHERGMEDTVEETILRRIATTPARPAYVMYFEHESGEADQVIEWTPQDARAVDRSPYELAESLGCALPRPRLGSLVAGRRVTILPGMDSGRVVQAVGERMRDAGYDLVPCSRGTALRHPSSALAPAPPRWLVDAFPRATMIVVTVGPEKGRFAYRSFEDGQLRAAFLVPPSPIVASMGIEELGAVDGERDPVRILRNLGLDVDGLDV
jgi:hypothetical protein